MKDITGKNFFVPNTTWTSKRKYNQVKSTYKLGCEECTEMDHYSGTCPGPLTKKRARCSGTEEPTGKKNPTG